MASGEIPLDITDRFVNYAGPMRKGTFRLGYGSIVRGYVRIGENVTIGNGTYIVSNNSIVSIGDNSEIGDLNVIKEGDDDERNKRLNIVIGRNVKTKSRVSLENAVCVGNDVYIGTGCVLGRNIKVGDGCKLNQNVNLAKNTTIGKNNTIYECAIGSAPQGAQYEAEGEVIIGDNNTFREFLVMNRGSEKGGGKTVVGNNNNVFSQVHIAHDCRIGDNNEIVTMAGLAGHVVVGNHVRISGLVGVAQFLHIGDYSFIAGASGVTRNVPPYAVVSGNPAVLKTVNKERLRRISDSEKECERILEQVRKAYEIIEDRSIPDIHLAERLRGLETEPADVIARFSDSLPPVKNISFLRFKKEK